jgi:hypothetical protein
MQFEEFEQSLQRDEPPAGLPLTLAALWWDAKGDWTKAHECAQQNEAPEHAWVHAYLHRKESDLDNARYWYERAGKSVFKGTLEDEWKNIAKALVSEHDR